MDRTTVLSIGVCFAILAVGSTARAAGDVLQTTEYQVTSDTDPQWMPVFGRDAIGEYVVYVSQPTVNGYYSYDLFRGCSTTANPSVSRYRSRSPGMPNSSPMPPATTSSIP